MDRKNEFQVSYIHQVCNQVIINNNQDKKYGTYLKDHIL